MLESSFLDIIQEMKKRVGLTTISTIVQRNSHSLQSLEKKDSVLDFGKSLEFLDESNAPMQNFVHDIYDMQQCVWIDICLVRKH